MHKLFPSQAEDETIHIVVRQHWVVLLKKLIIWFIFAAALVLFRRFGESYLPGLFESEVGAVTQLFVQVYTLFLTLSLFLIWLIYYLNVQIITDRRIVDIDQVGLFHHEVSELHIENIEDVTSDVSGVLGTIFNYGDVFVQTAGTVDRFEFSDVPSPGAINKLILDLYEQIPPDQRAHARRK
ncbi:MAG: hypothetical protein HYZ51_04780 [Candidatus Doudnabacteria bacterium]|nr:hypothetical protein [Candidatus Doudnabacteria bacterium]